MDYSKSIGKRSNRTALRKLYSSEKITIQLHPLPQAAIQSAKLKDGEVTPFGGSKSP
jgi:hypothetical protein